MILDKVNHYKFTYGIYGTRSHYCARLLIAGLVYLVIYACYFAHARSSMAVRVERLASVDQDVESDADDENPGPSTSKKQKMSAKSVGAAKYRTKFQKEWTKVYPLCSRS